MMMNMALSNKSLDQSIRKVLVIRFGSLGDIVLTLPVLKIIHDGFPQAELHYVLKEQYRDVLIGNPIVASIHCLPAHASDPGPFRQILTELRFHEFDVIIDLHANIRSRLLSLLCRSKRVLRYNKGAPQRRLLVKTGYKYGDFPHTVERYRQALSGIMALPDVFRASATFPLLDNEKQWASEKRSLLLSDQAGPVLAMSPGARHTTKCWLKEGFVEAGRAFLEKHPTAAIILFGDGSERALCDDISQSIGHRCVTIAGELSIRESAALLSTCDLLVSNDSGLMHLAAALQVPLIALFGPTSRELGFFPLAGPVSTVLEVSLTCRPCSLHGGKSCPLGTHDCMRKISVERVVNAIEETLMADGKTTGWEDHG